MTSIEEQKIEVGLERLTERIDIDKLLEQLNNSIDTLLSQSTTDTSTSEPQELESKSLNKK